MDLPLQSKDDNPKNAVSLGWIMKTKTNLDFCKESFIIALSQNLTLDQNNRRNTAKDFSSLIKITFSNGDIDLWSVGVSSQKFYPK